MGIAYTNLCGCEQPELWRMVKRAPPPSPSRFGIDTEHDSAGRPARSRPAVPSGPGATVTHSPRWMFSSRFRRGVKLIITTQHFRSSPLGPIRPIGLATALCMAVCLSACASSTPALNTSKVQQAIAGSVLSEHHLRATVACPPKVPARAGHTFTCAASLSVGSYPIRVTEINASGHVRYENPTPLAALDTTRVEAAIRQSILGQRHLRSTVACPGEVLQQAGVAFTCSATVAGRSYRFAVTEVDGDGHVRYLGL